MVIHLYAPNDILLVVFAGLVAMGFLVRAIIWVVERI